MNNIDIELIKKLDIEDIETVYDNIYDIVRDCDELIDDDSIGETIKNSQLALKDIVELDDNMYDIERMLYATEGNDNYKDEGRFINRLIHAYNSLYHVLTVWVNNGMQLDEYSVLMMDIKEGRDALQGIIDILDDIKGEFYA